MPSRRTSHVNPHAEPPSPKSPALSRPGSLRVPVTTLALVVGLVSPVLGNDERVGRRDFYDRIERRCVVEAGDPFRLAAPFDGRIELSVDEGQAVDAGALLARYDDTQWQRELRMARQRLDALTEQVAQIAGPLTEARRQLQQLDLDAIERQVAAARDAHSRALELASAGRLSDRRLEETAETLQRLEDDLVRQITANSIFEIETALQLTELRNTELDYRTSVERLEEQVEQARILSPVAGQVSFVDPQLAELPGLSVRAGTHVASVAQPGRRWARLGLTASEAERLRGAEALIRDTEGMESAARIVRIGQREDAAPWEKERFRIVLSFDVDDGFLVGSDAVCLFRRLLASDVLAVPLGFVSLEDDRASVLREVGQAAAPTAVTTGRVDPPWIEITNGLSAGDRIRRP